MISGDSGSAGGNSLDARSGSIGLGSGRVSVPVEARAWLWAPHIPCAKCVGDTGDGGAESESVVADDAEDCRDMSTEVGVVDM